MKLPDGSGQGGIARHGQFHLAAGVQDRAVVTATEEGANLLQGE